MGESECDSEKKRENEDSMMCVVCVENAQKGITLRTEAKTEPTEFLITTTFEQKECFYFLF